MLYIRKGRAPQELIEDRATPDSTFDGIRKEPVRKALLEEQGNLCAYCMCRIENDPTKTRIEHYKSQSRFPELQLDYKNMLAVCTGGEGGDPAHYTCDKSRANACLHINPQERSHMEAIWYHNDGRIDTKNENFRQDIDTLNLNDTGLVGKRSAALNALKLELHKMFRERTATQRSLEKLLQQIEGQMPKRPFCGILIWYLQKRVAVQSA